ncbi:MAG: type II CRISPR-associated endonuclease Cas1, partial [Oscillospiraceae bacterium]
MAYRNLFISSSAKLTTQNNNLVVTNEVGHSIPLEDINSIMIESRQVNISSSLLSKVAENKICLFICDEKHMPCGVMLPFNAHFKKLAVLESQFNLLKPLKKNIWKQIVMQKIENQAKVLEIMEIKSYETVACIAKKVSSGDSENMEAVAASKYFKLLFGKDFTRGQENGINACLNYGYAILRGMIARTLVVYGFEPSIGLFHKSKVNAFNLADDIIEVYRPIVDLYTIQNIEFIEPQNYLTPKLKQGIYNLINLNVISAGEKHSVTYAID